MKTNRQVASYKETWQAGRKRYVWHLRPPFDKTFDRLHWWKGKPNPEPVAALYELARRHPLVGYRHYKSSGQSGINPLVDSEALGWLAAFGLKSWPKLTSDERSLWQDSAGNMKGVDCRDSVMQCSPIILLALSPIQTRREIELRKKPKTKSMTHDEFLRFAAQDIIKKPLSEKEIEAAIARLAVEAYRRGDNLLAVAPDLSPDKAAGLLAEAYRDSSMVKLRPTPRARCEDWLPLIATFEDDETTDKDCAKSQVFARYRRVVDGLRFPTRLAETIGGIRFPQPVQALPPQNAL